MGHHCSVSLKLHVFIIYLFSFFYLCDKSFVVNRYMMHYVTPKVANGLYSSIYFGWLGWPSLCSIGKGALLRTLLPNLAQC